MSLVQEQSAFLLDFCKLVQYATSIGFTVTSGELLRPVEMQEIYVRTGRSKTMKSKHLQKLAGDLCFFKNGKYICNVKELEVIGNYWESLSSKNKWGGHFKTFKDAPHFERAI